MYYVKSIPSAQRSVARVVLFSVVTVCDFLFVWMFVCQHNNSTHEPFKLLKISSSNFQGIILGSKGRPNSKMAIVGSLGSRFIAIASDVLFCNVGRRLANDAERNDA